MDRDETVMLSVLHLAVEVHVGFYTQYHPSDHLVTQWQAHFGLQ